MSKVTDAQAWQLSIDLLRRAGESIEVTAVERMLEEDGLEKAGRWAAHAMQFKTLRSAPWLVLPCHIDDPERTLTTNEKGDPHGRYAAALIVKRLREYEISRWHPDPMAALREAERDAAA
jgi:hypothetical protein